MKDIYIPVEEARKAGGESSSWVEFIQERIKMGVTAEQMFYTHAREMGGVAGVGAYSTLMIFSYLQYGEQVFALTPWQQRIFELTDLPKGDDVELLLPYNGFWIALPERKEVLWGGSVTGWHRLAGVYVAPDPVTKGIAMVALGRPTKNSRHVLDDAALYFNIEQRYFGNMEKWLETHKHLKLNYEAGIDPKDQKAEAETRNKVMELCGRLALNFLMYMSTKNPDVQESPWFKERRAFLEKKPKKNRKELGKLPVTPIKVVGAKVQKEASARMRDPSVKENLRLHWVRGHYKRYWVGKGRTTLRWVQVVPHLRGTVPSDEEARVYEVA